jgi:hypothetical protein
MNRLPLTIAALLAPLTVLGCDPPLVIQGSVVAVDSAAQVISVKDERPPNATLDLSVAGAEIGAAPVVGDLVRVAYHNRANGAVAGRVMNISKQTELKASQGKH